MKNTSTKILLLLLCLISSIRSVDEPIIVKSLSTEEQIKILEQRIENLNTSVNEKFGLTLNLEKNPKSKDDIIKLEAKYKFKFDEINKRLDKIELILKNADLSQLKFELFNLKKEFNSRPSINYTGLLTKALLFFLFYKLCKMDSYYSYYIFLLPAFFLDMERLLNHLSTTL